MTVQITEQAQRPLASQYGVGLGPAADLVLAWRSDPLIHNRFCLVEQPQFKS
jgi:hypothetical protein